ncbi:hypothetical protein RB195_009303 [Necator americanus]|uniref:Endonuclease/exonuclease/phosphatase domain-containing protein n=1 Tax=Necator americanus TaxID=51031 RepID=A0ABR1CU45_NECAM
MICSYNARTLASEAAIEDLMMQAKKIRCDVYGLTDTRRHPLNAVYETRELFLETCESRGVGGDGVPINTTLTLFVAHTPTSNYEKEEVEAFYMDLEEFYREDHAFYKVIIGDFNAKVGPRTTPEELHIGTHGLQWNDQGERLAEFIMTTKTIHGNSQFQKPSSLRWTWESPDRGSRNEIDHIIVNKRFCLTDVAVVPKFYTGSNHRLLRGRFSFTRRKEKAAKFRERSPRTIINRDLFVTLAGFWEDSAMDSIGEEYDRTRREQPLHREGGRRKSSTTSTLISSTCPLASSPFEGRWTCHFTGSPSEIRHAMLSERNRTAPGPDRIRPEHLKSLPPVLINTLARLFTRYLSECKVPEQWETSKTVFLYKKGDPRGVILNRIEKVLDEGQTYEQAGFRKGFSTIDHTHTVSKLNSTIARVQDAAVSHPCRFKEVFDSIETETVMEALDYRDVPTQYIKMGLRKGYTISRKIFTATLENAMLKLEGDDMGVKADGRISQVERILTECDETSGCIGLQLNLQKKMFLRNGKFFKENYDALRVQREKRNYWETRACDMCKRKNNWRPLEQFEDQRKSS